MGGQAELAEACGARDVAWSFQSTFVPALITKGGPNFATLFLPLYIYENGFGYLRFGYSSAMTVAMFILTILMVGVRWGAPTVATAGPLNLTVIIDRVLRCLLKKPNQ